MADFWLAGNLYCRMEALHFEAMIGAMYSQTFLSNHVGTVWMETSCATILQFFSLASDGATTAPNLEPLFGQFRTSLRKHSVASYATI